MPPRIRNDSDEGSPPRKRIRLHDCPPIKTLEDLIVAGDTGIYYRNIDMIALWRIIPHLKKLRDMIGLESVKVSIFRQVLYYLQGMHTRDTNGEYLHTVISGPPGTGKTSIAWVLASIYCDLGILGDGNVRLVHRDDLVAGYVGQTAIKTKKLLNSCIGGVVFFDEAYSMGSEDKSEGGDSFAKEAIDILTSFLSEHKTDMCFIIAGYEEEINKCFFSINKGLERRFPWRHKIHEYTPLQLGLIAKKIIEEIHWSTFQTAEDISVLIKENAELFKNAGGDVENYISKCKIAHANRVFTLPVKAKFILTKDDFVEGIKILKENKNEHEKRYMNMYT